MARAKGGDRLDRKKGGVRGRKHRVRQVYVFCEGEVTEAEYIAVILREGAPARPDRTVQHHIENATAPTKIRKPLTMVRAAIPVLRTAEREAKAAGLRKTDWNWPQVWVLFDRDDHPDIPRARKEADEAGVRVAYSHPCFELWRLLHYQNYTSTFGAVCGNANSRLRQQPGFAQTYGEGVKRVSEAQSKHVREAQVLSPRDGEADAERRCERYDKAKKYAQRINDGHRQPDPNTWDPFTDVWRFVEDGLLLRGY